ncbi:hypothetical protein Pla123a_01170 [Posidoniimonas polymericola]|uniref:Uncharacterized protein n=1 Tax=Posidoniimonas polymericola TaxID=2528002 RepID=A0A5C5ZDS0_9BACT|nr:hypothetical protein [Posidoniimonas polymericola]TWT85310.1 hypothetical protein Pla123a_01170 [Posidoniimonas polymericola]
MPARTLLILLPLVLLSLAVGCSSWNAEKWDPSRLRDPRAADIDHRLSARPATPVRPPFSSDAPTD